MIYFIRGWSVTLLLIAIVGIEALGVEVFSLVWFSISGEGGFMALDVHPPPHYFLFMGGREGGQAIEVKREVEINHRSWDILL